VIVYYGSGGSGLLVVLLVFLGVFVLLPLLMVGSFVRGARRVVVPAPYDSGYQPAPAGPSAQPELATGDVVALRDRLAHDVRTLQPGDDPVARQALADAAERHATCTALLERARTPEQRRTAWLAAAEGLHATRVVRTRLGLDPGPVPQLPTTGPALSGRSRVRVGDREVVAAPHYEPGLPHWFPGGQVGGRHLPGGWYATAFWPGALTGLALGGLLGSALGGAAAGDLGEQGWGDGDGGWSDGGGGWGDGGGDW
jgi:hypothetical protein